MESSDTSPTVAITEKNADNGVPTVEITYNQLKDCSSSSENSSIKPSDKTKRNRRPDVAIYVPGSRSVNKQSNPRQSSQPAADGREDSAETNLDTSQGTDQPVASKEPGYSKKKKPELQVYVPKRRDHKEKGSETGVNSDDKAQCLSEEQVAEGTNKSSKTTFSSKKERKSNAKADVSNDDASSDIQSSGKERFQTMIFTNSTKAGDSKFESGGSKHEQSRKLKESSPSVPTEVSEKQQSKFCQNSESRYKNHNKRTDERRTNSGNAYERTTSHKDTDSHSANKGQPEPAGASSLDIADLKESIESIDNNIKKSGNRSKEERHHSRPNNRYSAKREARQNQAEISNKQNHQQKSDKSKDDKSRAVDRTKVSSKEARSGSSGRRSKDFSQDSRLFDPYAKAEPRKDSITEPSQSSRRGGLIKLPQDISTQSRNTPSPNSQSTSASSGNRALYNPSDPSSPIQVQTDQSDFRMLGGGDYNPLMGSPNQPDMYGGMMPAQPAPPVMMSSAMYPAVPFYSAEYNYMDEGELYQRLETSSKPQKVPLLIRDVLPLEKQLSSLVSRRLDNKAFDHMHRLRVTVRDKLEQIISIDLDYSVGHNVDQMLWKCVYHHVIENMRRELQEEDNSELRERIADILEEADEFYTGLIAKLEKSSNFSLSDYTSSHRNPSYNKALKLSLIMTQRILVSLGDIARYRTQNNQATDYGRSRKYYLQASHVIPKNGKPYNQLAIIAIYAKRKLDSVFYFTRSIAASNAFLSAKESLRGIYHDVIKRYEQTRIQEEQMKLQRKQARKNDNVMNRGRSDYKRIEVWISPIDGSSVSDSVNDDTDIEDVKKMPCNELYKRLMNTYLCCQGLIFSKVGMENFPEASSQVLYQLQALCNHNPIPLIEVNKLIQMFAVSMFSIHHSGVQVSQVTMDAEQCRSYIQEQAVLLLLDMLTVIVDKCITILSVQETITPNSLTSDDLVMLLPIVKLVTDWMTCHPNLWNPPPCPRDPTLGPVIDPWLSIAKLANLLTQINTHQIQFCSEEEYDLMEDNQRIQYVWLSLIETNELRGFLPLMNLAADEVFIKQEIDIVEASQIYRVGKLVTFADYLCGVEPAMLDFNTSTAKYDSLIAPPSLSEKQESKQITPSHNESHELANSDAAGGVDSDQEERDDDISDELSELRRKKRELSQQLAEQKRQQQAHQAALEKEDHLLQLEIRPIFLIPDTNCFIEYLASMKKLILCKRFTVVVPLVVINELDGLSRNSLPDKYSDLEHGKQVQVEATKAVEFLELQFESRNNRLKALTVSGTELETITYRSEETNAQGNNDDKILSCCLHYCTDNARDFMPKHRETKITLMRQVVLLTDDRNLRLKAHTRNVPVKDLLQFMEWAKI